MHYQLSTGTTGQWHCTTREPARRVIESEGIETARRSRRLDVLDLLSGGYRVRYCAVSQLFEEA